MRSLIDNTLNRLPGPLNFSLRDTVRDLLWPRVLFGRVTLGLVILKPVTYWMVFTWVNPDAPWPIHLLYRGDFGVFPLIRAFSELNFGEAVVFETAGKGLTHYPVTSLLPYALAYRLFGPFGYLITDLIIAIALYTLLSVWLRIMGISQSTAQGASLLAVSYEGYLKVMSHHWFGFLFTICEWRLPRPFVSQLFFLLCLIILFSIRYSPGYRRAKWTWFLLGLSAAILAQGDPWTWTVFIAAFVAMVLYIAATQEESLGVLATRVAIFVVSAILGGLPLIIQKAYEHPDVARRLGVMELSRGAAFQQLPLKSLFYVAAVCTLSMVVARVLVAPRELADRVSRIRGVHFLILLCGMACMTPSACVIFAGKTVQHWHFRGTLATVMSLTLLVLLLNLWDLGCAAVVRLLKEGRISNRAFSLLVAGSMIAVLVLSLGMFQAAKVCAQLPHAKEWCPNKELRTEIRRDFIRLANELSRNEYKSLKVVGSFDYDVIGWWVSFMGGYSYLSDTTTSTLSDSEIERRLMTFCKIIGMTARQFLSLMEQGTCNYLWLGHAKYEVFRYHTLAELTDYDMEDRKRILDMRRIEGSLKIIPNSERVRLINAFNSISIGQGARLDSVILTKHADFVGLHPPEDTFRLAYENQTYKMWVRRDLSDSSRRSNNPKKSCSRTTDDRM